MKQKEKYHPFLRKNGEWSIKRYNSLFEDDKVDSYKSASPTRTKNFSIYSTSEFNSNVSTEYNSKKSSDSNYKLESELY